MGDEPTYEIHRIKVCQEPGCSASYSTSTGAAAMHTRATGHHNWKNKLVKREKQATRISYQPGYGDNQRG